MTTATKDNAVSTAQTSLSALLIALHARSFSNSTASAQEDAIVNTAFAQMEAGVNGIDYSAPAVVNPGGTPSKPVSYSGKSNFTISGLSFSGGTSDFLTLTNCSNVHITLCSFANANVWAINLSNCTNVTVDNCFFTMICKGVMAKGGSGINVINNQFLNLNEPVVYKGDFAHFVQFNGVTGAGNRINNNAFENIYGVAVHPHDLINCFNCAGTSADPLQVNNNVMRGGMVDGGWPGSGDTGAGITFDNGTNIICQGNKGVNPGCAFIQINTVSGGTHNNVIVSGNQGVSLIPSKVAADGIIALGTKVNVQINNNLINWLKYNGAHGVFAGGETGFWAGGKFPPVGITMTGNNWFDTTLTASILPSQIITYHL